MKNNEFLEKIKEEKDIFKKHLLFAVWISKRLKEKGLPLPIIVGGSAVEIYTGAFYVSGDIDIVFPYRKEFEQIIMDTGLFEKQGKNFISKELGIYVEIVDDQLAGSYEKVNTIQIDKESEIKVIGIEDLIIDRLNSCVHWNSESDCELAEVLIKEFEGKLDINYLKKRSKEELVENKLKELLKDENGNKVR